MPTRSKPSRTVRNAKAKGVDSKAASPVRKLASTRPAAAQKRAKVGPFAAPHESAKAASLHHVNDDTPGISRRPSGKGFAYVGPDGKPIKDVATLARIKSLVIPPAWTNVWICDSAEGHLQATGRDARGRKQYRYHHHWSRVRDETKYGRAALFGESLPAIRKQVDADLQKPGLSRERVLATIVRLLELTFIRVGNTEYAKSNKSFGLTTLQDRHVQIAGANVVFKFRGKSGVSHEVRLTDKKLAQLIKRCRDVPGQDLFQYLDDSGTRHPVRSNDVNEYLRSIAASEFTAKDFRTWAGTLLASDALLQAYAAEEKFTKATATQAVQTVAAQLGNTPAVCKKCYIHPAVLKAFDDASLLQRFAKEFTKKARIPGLTPDESALLRFLKTADAKASTATPPT